MLHLFKKPRNIICVIVILFVIALLLWQNYRITSEMKQTALRDGFSVGKEID